MAFHREGISALGLLSSCHLAGLLQQRFVTVMAGCMKAVGRSLDPVAAVASPWMVPKAPVKIEPNCPSLAADYGDRAILYKPEGWEADGSNGCSVHFFLIK